MARRANRYFKGDELDLTKALQFWNSNEFYNLLQIFQWQIVALSGFILKFVANIYWRAMAVPSCFT
jgi:hypothetical protein